MCYINFGCPFVCLSVTLHLCEPRTEATVAYPTFCYNALEPDPELCSAVVPRCIVCIVRILLQHGQLVLSTDACDRR